nr:Fanconi anemia group A protein-like isoform X2 [Pseudochaenichthys georgianus]
MSLSASCESVSQKRTLSSLLAGRVVKRRRQAEAERLQEETLQLLGQQQSLGSLLMEGGNPDPCNIFHTRNGEQKETESKSVSSAMAGSLLVFELRCQAVQLGVPVPVLSVKMVLERLMEITGAEEVKQEEGKRRELLTASQREQLCVLLGSSRELLSQGALCPKLLWQEYRRDQRLPQLEVVYHLDFYNIVTLKHIIESDEGVRLWVVSQLKALCGWTPPPGEEETRRVQQKVLSAVVGVLVGAGFEQSPEAADRRGSLLCCSLLDLMLFWLLDTMEQSETQQSAGAERWIQIFDASLCGASASVDTLQRFFTHSLTQTLTYKPRLTVSDAISLQNEWTFAKASRLLTSLFRKLAVMFSVQQLLAHLQQVLETNEVNWKHVLCFLSTLLVYNPGAQGSLTELLSRLLSSAFEGYDLESMITAFLLARQGALEGAAIFPSYSNWFKMSFGGCSGYHASSKKSLVFLLKFLSDLVPFEPQQYLKVHVLQPPFVPVKHRSLLMEYVSLAKTRLADLKECVEDMGLYEHGSGAGGASLQVTCQAVQDVEKALSLFDSTGRISATVMEASIFRRPYFLTRFLPALLTQRTLPVKADARMSFIGALKKADKIPAAQYSCYVESCQRHRQQQQEGGSALCVDTNEDPLQVLKVQLQEFTQLVVEWNDGEACAQLSRISHTLSVIFPGRPDDLIGQTVIKLHTHTPLSPELHVKVVNMILRNFCQCMLDASRETPPNKQSPWASRLVSGLLSNTQLLSSLLHRLWDLFHNQGSSLSAAQLLGLSAFVVHLHASMSHSPLVQLVPPLFPEPVSVGEALSAALLCSTHTDMLFCVRFCVAAVRYGMCRGDSLPQQQQQQQQQDYIISGLYKKLLYLIPRLCPETRRAAITAGAPMGEQEEEEEEEGEEEEEEQEEEGEEEEELQSGLWSRASHSHSWRSSALQLWRRPAVQQLQHTAQYQLSVSEWLAHELRVQRSEDALSDPERQEFQQWACSELFLPREVEQGGCGGDMKLLCSHLLTAIMGQQSSHQTGEKLDERVSERGSCLPDILSRLQELVYDMEVTALSGCHGKSDMCDFLFELLSKRCSFTEKSISTALCLQHTLNTWNRVLLALPAGLLLTLPAGGRRAAVGCQQLMEHINLHQRSVCSPVGLLSYHLTSHFLRGVLCASVRCGRPREEVDKAWSQISVHCPLLLLSTVHWWQRLSPVLSSLWRGLTDGDPLPEQLQLLAVCQSWACSLEKGPCPPGPAALLLAASLHGAWQGRGGADQGLSAALRVLREEGGPLCQQVLVFLLFLCVKDHLSSLLYPEGQRRRRAAYLCSELLSVLVDSADWLLLFQSDDHGVYQSITMVTSDEFIRLMPWAFYSLLLQQSAELLHRAVCGPHFLHTAVLCYIHLLQLFLEGHTLPPADHQPFQIVSHSKQLLLRAIAQTPPTALSTSQLREILQPHPSIRPSQRLQHTSSV